MPTTSVGMPPVPENIVNSIGMRLVRVPAGEFWMGSPDSDPDADADERPRRRVRITRSFLIGAFEVTQGEFERVMGENPSWFCRTGPGKNRAGPDTRRHPVDMASWNEAVEFCRRLSELTEERAAGRLYRLPTEAEWEYAARAGVESRFCRGEELAAGDGNVHIGEESLDGAREGRTMPVGGYAANAFGLHDVEGNVWEWCADWYAADYYRQAPLDDPQGPSSGSGRVVRGGDWFHTARHARLSNRDFTRASRRDLGNGFRVVSE